MAKKLAWYSGGFILVTVAESRNGDYQHPRVSICKRHEWGSHAGGHTLDSRLPKDLTDPAAASERLITFEFQQNLGRNFDSGGMGVNEEKAPAWLNFREDGQTGRSYGGHLETRIRLESSGISFRHMAEKLASIDTALIKLSAAAREIGATATDDDVTKLVLALKRSFKLPVLFVAYRVSGPEIVEVNPDLSMMDLARRIARADRDTRPCPEAN